MAGRERVRWWSGGRPWRRLRRRVGRERLRWAVRIRGAAIASFLAVAVVAWAAGLVTSLRPVIVAAVAGSAMNAVAAVCVRRWRGVGAMILWSGAGDAVLITAVVRATGGARSPFLFLYAVQVVTAALVLGVRLAALAGGAGLALLAAAVLGTGGWPPRAASVESERLVWLLSLALTLGLLGFIGGHLTRRLARTERELAGAHGRLARSLRRLGRTHGALQQAYARLAAAESQLVAVEKMRAFGVLIAGVAHELGNPLAVLVGNLEPIEQMIAAYEAVVRADDEAEAAGPRRAAGAALELDEWRREAPVLLANCREATERAVALLAKLRSLGTTARSAELHLAPLRPGLESTVALVRHRLPAGVRVVARYDDVPEVLCDPAELNQVFMNLLLNAADALAPGGTLAVELLLHGRDVTVVVRDDGPGIAPAILPRIFEPFFTTKAVGQGSGLGLAISRTIVDRHGGRLEARVPAAGGAELVVALPLPGSAPEVGRRPDVEAVAQAVAEEVEGEHRHHDRDAGDDRQVRRDEQEGATIVQHRPP